MGRKFKVSVGEKTFIVEVEELPGESLQTPITRAGVYPSKPVKEITQLKPLLKETMPKPVGAGVVRAPIPGVVVSLKCCVNDRVRAGDVLLILETMKMENEIYSPKDGVVRKIAVSEGAQVSSGSILVEID